MLLYADNYPKLVHQITCHGSALGIKLVLQLNVVISWRAAALTSSLINSAA
jgi:hypothetical protein